MKNKPLAGKATRTKIFTVITVASLILLIALNLFVTSFGIFGNAYIDLTPEGLYTLRDEMTRVCSEIFLTEDGKVRDPDKQIKITFCDDPDNLIANTSTRLIYYMAVAIANKFDNCELEYVNVRMTPTAVARYKTTSLTEIDSDDVIVSYGTKDGDVLRYSITSAEKFWHVGSDGKVYAFDGEYKLASILLSLTLVNRPAAYFVTDHNTTYYDVSNKNAPSNAELGNFVDLLNERGLEIKNLSLAELINGAAPGTAPSIPEDCVLLIINDPKEDFDIGYNAVDLDKYEYISETEVLDRYMTEERGSIMVTKDYTTGSLPNFDDFLAEWGIECTGMKVKDDDNYIKKQDDAEDHTTVIADYELTEGSYAASIYGDFASLSSAPRVIVSDTGTIVSAYGDSVGDAEAGSTKTSRIFAPLLYTSASSVSFGKYNGEYNESVVDTKGKQIIAAVSGRQTIDSYSNERTYSYIFCAATNDFFGNALIGNASYANYDIVSALVQNIARLETHAPTSLGGLSLNNSDDTFGGKMLADASIRETDEYVKGVNDNGDIVVVETKHGLPAAMLVVIIVAVTIIPLAVAIVGIVVCLKRRYL